MSDLISTMFQNLTDIVTNSATALKTAFENIVYVDPSATQKKLSDLVQFVFLMMGVTIGIGIVYKILSLVRIGRR